MMPLLSAKRLFDPMYGVTELSDSEYEIIQSPEIQRLRYVRMCNINSLLVTGASEISRFEHVLGVLRLAKEWCEHHSEVVSSGEQKAICAAALLHDFQTGPFGHSMQYVLEDNDSEEQFIHDDIAHGGFLRFHQTTDWGASFAGRMFRSRDILGSLWGPVAAIIKGEGRLGKLISGTVDLDNIDNVLRLAYHVGIVGHSASEVAVALARDLDASEAHLVISERSVPLMKEWQRVRRRLYELLLLDWADFAAKAMLTRALELAVQHNLLGPDSWLRTDLELLEFLERESVGDAQSVAQLVKRIKCGDLYEPLLLGHTPATDTYDKFTNITSKQELEARLKHQIWSRLKLRTDVIIHPILDHRKTDRSVEVLIRETGQPERVGVDSNRLLLGVFSSNPVLSDSKRDSASLLAAQFLESEGAIRLSPIQDPMRESKGNQISLL